MGVYAFEDEDEEIPIGVEEVEEDYTPLNLHFDHDYTLGIRACMTAVVGREYIYALVNETINQYIDRFNDKVRFSADFMEEQKDIRIVNNVLNTDHNDYHYTVHKLSPLLASFEGKTAVFSVDYEARSTEGLITSSSTFKGKIQIRLGVQYKEQWGKPDGVPQIFVKLAKTDDFVGKFITFGTLPFFDQPAAARTLIGLVRTMNEIASKEAGSAYVDN